MKSRASLVLGSIVVFAAAMIMQSMAAELPETKFNYIASLSVQPQHKIVEKPFYQERLPEKSGGAIQVTIRAWNELGLKGPEIMRLVKKGTYTAGAVPLAYNSGDLPINDAMDLAGQSPDIPTLRKVIDAFGPVFKEFYEKNVGLKVLSLSPYPPQLTFCRDEFTSLKDFKGRKVRVSTASQAKFVRAMGGTDVNMSSTEVQSALQTGVVDCGVTSAMSAYKQGWYEAAKYILPLPINWQLLATEYNLETWNKFDPGIQRIIEEQTVWLESQLWEAAQSENEMGINCMTEGPCSEGKPAGMNRVKITDADRQLLRETFETTILQQWAAQCGKECAQQYNETIGKVLGLRAPVK